MGILGWLECFFSVFVCMEESVRDDYLCNLTFVFVRPMVWKWTRKNFVVCVDDSLVTAHSSSNLSTSLCREVMHLVTRVLDCWVKLDLMFPTTSLNTVFKRSLCKSQGKFFPLPPPPLCIDESGYFPLRLPELKKELDGLACRAYIVRPMVWKWTRKNFQHLITPQASINSVTSKRKWQTWRA